MKLSKLQWELWEFVSLNQPVSMPQIKKKFPISALDALCNKGILKMNDYNHVEEKSK